MKTHICFILFLFCTINSYSQPAYKITHGIKAGVAFADIKMNYVNNSSSPGIKMKTDIVVGSYLNIAANKHLVFQPALLYVGKGTRDSRQDFYSYPYKFNYLEIPLNMLYKSQVKNGIYFIGGGLSPAFLLNNKEFRNEIKSFDLGINVLAAYMLPIGFSINLGYTYGLVNLSNNKEYISNIQNRYFSIAAGYEF